MSTKQQGFATISRAMTDAMCRMTWGSPSVQTWAKEAEQRTVASQVRRSRGHGRPTLGSMLYTVSLAAAAVLSIVLLLVWRFAL